MKPSDSTWPSKYRLDEQENDDIGTDEIMADDTERTGYVSRTAVALRCRVMPPPCLKNPYLMNESDTATDPFGYQRSKCASESSLLSLFDIFMRGLGIIEALLYICF